MRTSVVCSLLLFFCLSARAAGYKTGADTCYGFPEIPSLRQSGRCVGLVADETKVPWSMPRKLLFDDGFLYVTATGSWDPNEGQLWRLELKNNSIDFQLLQQNLDRSHGIRKGVDGKIYVGEATRIFRFDPKSPSSKEIVITNLPDRYVDRKGHVLPSNHPLTEFIVLPNGDLVVNVGAPSNDCSDEFQSFRACHQRDQQAELRIYHYNPTDKTYDSNFKVLARGLRNSMGLLFNQYTQEVYQAENAADAPGTPDEVNVIHLGSWLSGKTFDFGWPFCSGAGDRPAIYANFRTFCSGKSIDPLFLLPPHAAPLDMMYYSGKMFSDFRGGILMSWHGHRPSGSRIAVYPVNATGQPRTAQPQFLLEQWSRDSKGGHPKGRPVGLAEDADGAVFVVDDANSSLLVIAKTQLQPIGGSASLDSTTPTFSQAQLSEWIALYPQLIASQQCQKCHGDVVRSTPSKTLANFLKVGWILPATPVEKQLLWVRALGKNGTRVMPPPPASNQLLRSPQLLSKFESFLSTFSPR